jgi:hypothetical protein
MASGKKNYFRHSTGAFEDEKIQRAISLLGYEGYAYFFILLEVLAKQCENEFKNPIRIHKQTLKNVWRKQSKSCDKVLTKLEESGLFVVTKWSESDYKVDTFLKSLYEIDIPNLAKYMGKYESKLPPNSPNKRKEKENKIKENKEKENVVVEAPQVGSFNSELEHGIDEVFNAYRFTINYPRDVFEEFALEAYPIYLASTKPDKSWVRFLTAYIKNNKHRIEEKMLDGYKSKKLLEDDKSEYSDLTATFKGIVENENN